MYRLFLLKYVYNTKINFTVVNESNKIIQNLSYWIMYDSVIFKLIFICLFKVYVKYILYLFIHSTSLAKIFSEKDLIEMFINNLIYRG